MAQTNKAFMNSFNIPTAKQEFTTLLEKILPRILTQVCRDPSNPSFGCFDRNWWHYRIRDFASIIIQQGGYATLKASEALNNETLIPNLFAKEIAKGSAIFWDKRATRLRAFEEYYPWECGYPPVAFSSLAVAKLVSEGICPIEEVYSGLKKAARQLINRFEPRAANQQVAGLAALACIKKVAPKLVSDRAFKRVTKKTLALQSKEGWYMEYDGPDVGYLSVALDCLWDIIDSEPVEEIGKDIRSSADNALDFIYKTICHPKHGLGMFNARNTDYVVPYGIIRYMRDGTTEQKYQAAAICNVLFTNMADPNHFFNAVDDRYICHYIGHSIARGLIELNKLIVEEIQVSQITADISFPEANYIFLSYTENARALVACNKGGVMRMLYPNGESFNDFGWIVKQGKKQFISHWWSTKWESERIDNADGTQIVIKGKLFPHKEMDSTPFKHIVLRGISLCLGKSIINMLKGVMIFKTKESPFGFERRIKFNANSVCITDCISGLPDGELEIIPATRISKRHVASADSYNIEDAILTKDVEKDCNSGKNGSTFNAITTYRLKSKE